MQKNVFSFLVAKLQMRLSNGLVTATTNNKKRLLIEQHGHSVLVVAGIWVGWAWKTVEHIVTRQSSRCDDYYRVESHTFLSNQQLDFHAFMLNHLSLMKLWNIRMFDTHSSAGSELKWFLWTASGRCCFSEANKQTNKFKFINRMWIFCSPEYSPFSCVGGFFLRSSQLRCINKFGRTKNISQLKYMVTHSRLVCKTKMMMTVQALALVW